MTYHFDVVDVQPVTLALTEAEVLLAEVPTRIVGMFDVVYSWSREVGAKQTGQNYALYYLNTDSLLLQVGFPIAGRYPQSDAVRCVDFTGCKAAHTTHLGEYLGLPDAHSKLREWCDEQALGAENPGWEVYGDWSDDPSKLITDVYVRLR